MAYQQVLQHMQVPLMQLLGWADLPEELLNIILESLTDLSDLHQCRRVCTQWHYAATRIITSIPTPLLYLSTPTSESEVEVEDDQEQAVLITVYCKKPSTKAYKITLPNSLTQSHNSFMTHRGWFFLSDCKNRKNVFLYSPILRQTIKLPQFPQRNRWHPIQFVISSPPTDPNCVVLAYYFTEKGFKFIICTPSDERWKRVNVCDNVKTHGVEDMIHYKGDFYAVDWCGSLLHFDIGVTVPRIVMVSAGINDSRKISYLVESPSQKLVMVTRHTKEGGGTCLIKVYKMDWGRCNWERVLKFGDRESIFLAQNDSMFVSTDDYRSNRVYFFDDNWGYRNARIFDFGFHDMESETIKHIDMTSQKYSDASFYRWFKGCT